MARRAASDVTVVTLDEVENRLRPLAEASARAHWQMAGAATDAHRAVAAEKEIALEAALSDPALVTPAPGEGPFDARRAELLRLWVAPRQRPAQLAEQIIRLETELAGRFSAHRAVVGDREVDDNELDRMLLRSTDEAERRGAWRASRAVGGAVADELRELVALRNTSAERLGERDHYALSLRYDELDEAWLYGLLDRLDAGLAPAWTAERGAIDGDLRARLGLPPGTRIEAWHATDAYFQDAPPPVDDPLLDAAGEIDPVAACRAYFADLGHDVDAILERSDLQPRPLKDQHAFQTTIVRNADVRILCNLAPTLRWLETLLHELGHAIYDAAVDPSLPWLLRTNAHTFATEAIAMVHGRRGRDAAFLTRYAGVPAAIAEHPANAASLRRELLVFTQWVQVMARFERGLYADPGQDLDALWWSLVERYQGLPRPADAPAGAWAAKIHLTVAPVYYHNYLLGQILASQLDATIGCGAELTERFLWPGASLRWDALIERATGEPLTTDAFVADMAMRA